MNMNQLSGYKTYVMAGALAAFAGLGLLLGHLEPAKAWELLLEAGVLAGLRNAIR